MKVPQISDFFKKILAGDPNFFPKGVSFSDLICIFAVSIVGFSCFLFATLR